MDITIFPGGLDGTAGAIPSKSQAHRALICAALADNPTRIECDGESGDIAATIACLNALGASIAHEQGGYYVSPMTARRDSSANSEFRIQNLKSGDGECVSRRGNMPPIISPITLPCGESGSTFRFLLPIVCALGRTASFMPSGRLPQRPLSPLIDEIVRHGCSLSPHGSIPFRASGQLAPGYYTMDAGVSSQFVSGLLFALPLLDGNSELHLIGRVESFPYIELTLAALETFGVETEFNGTVFVISGGQEYRSPGVVSIEGDWSNAAFWLGAGAVGAGCITCTGLDTQSRQGDRAIMDILKRFGARVEECNSAVTVNGGDLKGVEIDAQDIPDLVPILAVVAASAEGITVIHNAGRLRDKESDRLAAITDALQRLGSDVFEREDELIICGGAPLTGGQISSWGDHRIAMAASIAATVCSGAVKVVGAEAVGKSYPGFFDDLRSLGGRIIEN